MRRLVGAAVLGALLLSGCYGSTEPATKVRADSAQLNARGTANDGPAYTFFRVQQFGVPLPPPIETPRRQWPAGASGAFSDQVSGLDQASEYSYRLCGGDAGEDPVCSNARDFETRGPDGQDSVIGAWRVRASADPTGGSVNARSDPDGGSPRGSLEITEVTDQLHVFKGFVTCLTVDGNKAVVGAVGLDQDQQGNDHPTVAKVAFSDEPDLFSREFEPGSTPPDCGEGFPAVNGAILNTTVITDN